MLDKWGPPPPPPAPEKGTILTPEEQYDFTAAVNSVEGSLPHGNNSSIILITHRFRSKCEYFEGYACNLAKYDRNWRNGFHGGSGKENFYN